MNKFLYYKFLSLLLIITTIYLFSPYPVQAGGVVSAVVSVVSAVVNVVEEAAPYIIGAAIGVGIGLLFPLALPLFITVGPVMITAGIATAMIGAAVGLATVSVLDATTCWVDVLWKGCANGGGGGGAVTLQVDVRVDGSDGPVSFIAPATFNVEWSSVASKSCSAIGSWQGDIPGRQGTSQISNLGPGKYNYGIKCIDEANNSASDSVIVNVIGPPIIDFRAPNTVEIPNPINLFWITENADSLVASGNWFGSKQTGTHPFKSESLSKPRGNYIFTLSATGPGGTASETRNVSVIQVPLCSFSADPTSIILPQTSTLSWSCSYANTCSIDQGIGSVNNVSGTKEVRPPKTTVYTLTCNGLDGERSRQATVNVGFTPRWREVAP